MPAIDHFINSLSSQHNTSQGRDRNKFYKSDNSLVKESGTGREVDDVELAGGEEDSAQLRVPLVDHQAHHTGQVGVSI